MKLTKRTILITVSLTLVSLASYGADASKKPMSMDTPEMRQKIAGMHQKMADCLRSDKPMATCKSEMMKECHESMGKEGCGMMKDMHGHGMGKDMGAGSSDETSSDDHKKHHP
jgi:hypothetical protein